MKKTITYFLIVGTILFIGWTVKNSGFSVGKDAKEYTNLGDKY